MQIMLLGSIRGKEINDSAIMHIVKTLEARKHRVIHDHITANRQRDLDEMNFQDNYKFHQQILKNIRTADLVIAETTFQSLSVGYLISYAVINYKTVVVLYDEKSYKPNLFPTLSEMGKVITEAYSDFNDLSSKVIELVHLSGETADVRFNFFISPQISRYLDWIANNKKIPRSVYLRKIIQNEMENNIEFNEVKH